MPAETGVRLAAVLSAIIAMMAHDDNDDPRTNRKISPDVCHEGFGDIEIGNDAAAAAAWHPRPQRTEAQSSDDLCLLSLDLARLVVGLW